MRILILAPSYFPEEPAGASRLAYDVACEFQRRGHEVWLLSQTQRQDGRPYTQHNGLHVLQYHLPPANGLDVFRHYRHIDQTKRMLKQYMGEPVGLINGHDLLPYVAAVEHFRARRPLTCYSIHSPAVEELPIVWRAQGAKGYLKLALGLPQIRRLELKALTTSALLEAESRFTRGRILAQYGRNISEKIRIIPGWTDHRRFGVLSQQQVEQARQELDWPVDMPVFFSLRRLEARMGLDRFLHALARLMREGFNFFTAIAGTGRERAPLEDLQARLGLQSRVRFMGRISDELLPLAYGACSASVIPTRALECFGIIALEAMSAGRPVLVTPVGALPEIVGGFEPAWVAKGNDERDVAGILRAFLLGDLPKHEPKALTQFVAKHYSLELGLQRYHDLFGI